MDLDPTSLVRWKFCGWLTVNVSLWPRTLLLVASASRWQALRDADRQVLREAAAGAVTYAAESLLRDARAAREYGPHIRCVRAGDEELDGLMRRFDVVYGELRT